MARAETNRLYTNFSKGLITEASHLAYPEMASIDEDNCDITTNGNRTRRFGFDNINSETTFTSLLPLTAQAATPAPSLAYNIYTHIWKNVNQETGEDWLVVYTYSPAAGAKTTTSGAVSFYKINPSSQGSCTYTKKAFTVDLSSYKLTGVSDALIDSSYVEFASGKGQLFIANKYMDPLRVEYDPDLGTITVNVIKIKVRDHYGIDDDLGVDVDPLTLTAAHHYNLLNQGWEYPGGGLATPTGATGSGPGGTVIPTDPTTPDIPFNPTPFPPPVQSVTPDPFSITNPSYDPSLPTIIIQPPPVIGDGYVERQQYSVTDRSYTYSFPVFDVTYTTPAVNGPIYKYWSITGYYPSNSKVWWVGKDADGNFSPALLQKTFFGNTRAPRGHFIIDAFTKNRSEASGIPSVPTVASATRPEVLCFMSGRVFYAHNTTVYMSPILEDVERAGQCYQEADPTSEDISDLIPTDGGFIEIPDADKILRLIPLADGLIVLCSNGVWFINAGGQGFNAVDYSLVKISDTGCFARESAVIAGPVLYYWSREGIQVLSPSVGQFGAIPGQFEKQNITDTTIKTFYNNNIYEPTRPYVKGAYDPASDSIYWIYTPAYMAENGVQQLGWGTERILCFNIKHGAFVPYSLGSENATLSHVRLRGLFTNQYYVKYTKEPTYINFICVEEKRHNTGSPTYSHYISLYQFVKKPGVTDIYQDGYTASLLSEGGEFGAAYPRPFVSYIESGYEVLQDGLRKKQVPFLGAFFKREETIDGVTIVNPSSCSLQVKWSWSNTSNTSKWSSVFQAYRPRNAPHLTSTVNLEARDDYDVIYSRNKIRGSGRAIQFRFYESSITHGFNLIGWHAFYQGNTVP